MSKQKKPTEENEAAKLDEACKTVAARLEDWRSWSVRAANAGLLTPAQFLAVVVWVLEAHKTDELTEAEMREAVSHWRRFIDWGFECKFLSMLHGVTLMPAPSAAGTPWVMSVSQLQDAMSRLPWAFDLEWALSEFKRAADEQAEEINTWEQAADLHKSQSTAGKKPRWTHTKLNPIAKAISSGVKVEVIAKMAGVKRQTLQEVLERYQSDPSKYVAPNPLKAAQASSGSTGGATLQEVWPAAKTA